MATTLEHLPQELFTKIAAFGLSLRDYSTLCITFKTVQNRSRRELDRVSHNLLHGVWRQTSFELDSPTLPTRRWGQYDYRLIPTEDNPDLLILQISSNNSFFQELPIHLQLQAAQAQIPSPRNTRIEKKSCKDRSLEYQPNIVDSGRIATRIVINKPGHQTTFHTSNTFSDFTTDGQFNLFLSEKGLHLHDERRSFEKCLVHPHVEGKALSFTKDGERLIVLEEPNCFRKRWKIKILDLTAEPSSIPILDSKPFILIKRTLKQLALTICIIAVKLFVFLFAFLLLSLSNLASFIPQIIKAAVVLTVVGVGLALIIGVLSLKIFLCIIGVAILIPLAAAAVISIGKGFYESIPTVSLCPS